MISLLQSKAMLVVAASVVGVAVGWVGADSPRSAREEPTVPAPAAAPVEPPRVAPNSADAGTDRARHIVIDRGRRTLWLVEGADTLLTAPVAVGSGDTLSYRNLSWRFATPAGVRVVRAKEAEPIWVPPFWHFVERAREAKRPLVDLAKRGFYEFPDGSRVVVRDGLVGHLLANGAFIPTEPGDEVVINGILFVPPLGSKSRQVRGELGAYKLDLGDGYLIHGTPHKDSIGQAATHGCIRVDDEDLQFLFENVPIGTEVHIR